MKNHFEIYGVDLFEGIYEKAFHTDLVARYKVGVIKDGDDYLMVYLGGAKNSNDWVEGEIKSEFIKTATPNLFKLRWRMQNKLINEDPFASFENGAMNIIWPDREKGLYIKLFPTETANNNYTNELRSSGTAFAITSDGFMVTNQHVVDGAKKIKVRGIKGNFNKQYHAKVIVEDKNNDLAILKIDDRDFTNFGVLPYTIKANPCDVGKSVFVLGYPLRATMGDEVKLTNGIISSKTGFQGDITTYQTTVPVQPGNSGGPLLNSEGDVIGIINAKHIGAENASYAIKVSYLNNLIDIIDLPILLPETNLISDKELSDQVKYIKEFIYILEIE